MLDTAIHSSGPKVQSTTTITASKGARPLLLFHFSACPCFHRGSFASVIGFQHSEIYKRKNQGQDGNQHGNCRALSIIQVIKVFMTLQLFAIKLDSIFDLKLQPINNRLDRVDERLDRIDDRLDKVESEVSSLKAGQLSIRKELNEVHHKVSDTYDLALEAWGKVRKTGHGLRLCQNNCYGNSA